MNGTKISVESKGSSDMLDSERDLYYDPRQEKFLS